MEGEDEDSEDERAFNNKPAWQRACVLAAGPFMNLLTAMLLLVVIATWAGQPTTTVSQVLDDSPAYEAGIQAGDEILSVDGTKIEEWNDLLTVVGQTKNDTVSFELDRDGYSPAWNTMSRHSETRWAFHLFSNTVWRKERSAV